VRTYYQNVEQKPKEFAENPKIVRIACSPSIFKKQWSIFNVYDQKDK
jgi:hypothetical protein